MDGAGGRVVVTQGPGDVMWWRLGASSEDIWNGPGDGLTESLAHIDPALTRRVGQPGTVAVDLGCGEGRLLIPLAAAHPRALFVGVDLVYRDWRLPSNATFRGTDGSTIPMRDETVDAVWSVLLFQHLSADAVNGYLGEMVRVLRPGGAVVFQFVARHVNSEPDGFLHYRHAIADVLNWCDAAGLELDGLATGDTPDWVWVTAAKP